MYWHYTNEKTPALPSRSLLRRYIQNMKSEGGYFFLEAYTTLGSAVYVIEAVDRISADWEYKQSNRFCSLSNMYIERLPNNVPQTKEAL